MRIFSKIQKMVNEAQYHHILYDGLHAIYGDYSNRRIFKQSKKSKLFKASKEFHSSD